MLAPRRCRVCALIWTYNPAPHLLKEVVRAASENVDYVLIVDNGSENHEIIEKFRTDKVDVAYLSQNLGVEAINRGLDILTTRNACDWVLILDDDSIIVEPNAVGEVLRRYQELPEEVKGKIGVISISDLESVPFTLKHWLRRARANTLIVHHDAVIFSGAMIKADVLIRHRVRARKELFLDHADTEFFAQIRRLGYMTALYTKLLLKHRRGIPLVKPLNLVFYEIKSTTKPHRLYYIVRNATYLLLKRGITPLQWFLSILRFAIPLMLQHPKTMIRVFVIGLAHGVGGRLGRWDMRL
jgi:GT2 family glycosyltransferase